MNPKHILGSALKTFIRTYVPEPLREDAYKKLYIAGGAVASVLMGEPPQDHDIYSMDRGFLEKLLQGIIDAHNWTGDKSKKVGKPFLVNIEGDLGPRIKIKSAGITGADSDATYDYFEGNPLNDDAQHEFLAKVTDTFFVTETAISFPKTAHVPKFQLIARFCGEPDEVVGHFDFEHTQGYAFFFVDEDNMVDGKGLKPILQLRTLPEVIEACAARELVYTGCSAFPVSSLFRTRKFIARGWTISAGQMLKIILACNKLDLTDLVTLRDQLIGVDAAYFTQLLRMLADDKGESTKVDAAYLCQLIDKMEW